VKKLLGRWYVRLGLIVGALVCEDDVGPGLPDMCFECAAEVLSRPSRRCARDP